MDWNAIGTEVIVSIIGVVIAAIGSLVTFLINKYVKDSKLKNFLLTLTEVVKNVVAEVQQTYVDGLKKDGMFDAEAQKYALNLALEKIKATLPADVMKWLKENQTDIDVYLKSLIEGAVYNIKK